MRKIFGILLTIVTAVVGGCASQANHFNADIVNSATVCKGKPFKTKIELVQCYGSAERPVILQDLPNLLHAYDFWHSARLSAAGDYDNEVMPVQTKANAVMKLQMDASGKKFSQAVIGIWPQAGSSDHKLLKLEADKASVQCMSDGIQRSTSNVVNFNCDQAARRPIIERRVPAATNTLKIFYSERLAIASDYDKAVLPAIQSATVKFNKAIAPAKSAFGSQAQLELLNDVAATARQRQKTADDVATLLMLLGAGMSGFSQGRGYGQPTPPLISTSCTTTNGNTNCSSF